VIGVRDEGDERRINREKKLGKCGGKKKRKKHTID